MKPVKAPEDRLFSIDELDRDIVNLSFHINAATYELLVLVREFDERAGWLQCGLANCAEWLHWRCDLSMSAAREKVRVAHALKTLPMIASSFSTGELSYSKVRPLTRVARIDNEDSLLTSPLGAPARDASASQTPECVDECWSALQANALVAIANAYLSGNGQASACTSDNYLVTVHVDHSALANGDGRSSLPLESVKRLCCDSDAIVIVENEEGEPLSVGRKTRTVPTGIKRALRARDKTCVFPGCHHTRFVDAHHVEHWSAGGETSLDNLLLLCSHHHGLVHEGGFNIERDFQNRWFFKRPDGRAVPSCGYRAQDMLDDGIDDGIVELSNLINNPSAEGLLSAVKTLSTHSPPL
jgi:hypothetical protein